MGLILRVLYRIQRMISSLRRRILRRFSVTGLVVFTAAVLTAAMGVDMESTAAYQAFTLMVALLLVSFCFSRFFRAKFSASRQLPRFGTAGQPFTYSVRLLNESKSAQSDLVLIEDLADTRPGFREWRDFKLAETKHVRSLRLDGSRPNPFKVATVREAPIPTMRPNEEVEVRMEIVPLRRGVLRYGGITVARPDPLGLIRALASFPLPQSALILPKRYPLPAVTLPGQLKYQEGGVALASRVGRSEEFVALRDYRSGDPLRHIHWRSWAKTGKPIVKEFADEFFVRHALVLDTFSRHPHGEAFEEAVSVAASFACTIQTQESLLDLLFVGEEAYCVTAGRGLAHADQMLEILASVRECSGKSFQTLESLVINHAGVVSGCVCILLEWDEARRKFVEKLKASGVPTMVLLVLASPPEKPLEPGPMADEPEHFHVLIAGQIERGLAKLG